MDLKFVATTKPTNGNPILQRRLRLLRRIDQQKMLIEKESGGLFPRASWIWMDENGHYCLAIKYGRDPIEMKKGMFAIQCDNIQAVAQALQTVKDMVLKGELDEHLAKASADIRAKFKISSD